LAKLGASLTGVYQEMDARRKFSGLKTDMKSPEVFKYAERQVGKRQRMAEKIKEL
jgi:hypothetical protein